METKDFFVMLSHPKSAPLIMMGDSAGGIAYFETYELAKEAAQDNDLGIAFGFEVFELGRGE